MHSEPLLFSDVMDQGGLILVRLDGVIDENNRLHERLSKAKDKKILLNLAKVERISSGGVRDFVRWIQELEAQGSSIHFSECSPPVVSQLNMVRNFCGQGGHVVSVQAPYFCQTCDAERRETFLTSNIGTGAEPPRALCPNCGEVMAFDDLPQSYFAFARVHGARAADPEVVRSMNRFEDVHLATKVVALKELSSSGLPGSTAPPIFQFGTTPRPRTQTPGSSPSQPVPQEAADGKGSAPADDRAVKK